MAKKQKPEDFSRIENKFKLSLLQIEKRFVELEVAVSEMREKLKDIEPQPTEDLRQRMEDIEDLIMVEQAGIMELKKVMEERAKPPEAAIPELKEKFPKLEEKLGVIEKSITDLVSGAELDKKLEKIEKDIAALSGKAVPTSTEMENLYEKLRGVEKNVNALKAHNESLLKALNERIKDVEGRRPAAVPGVDFDLLSSRIGAMKVNLEELSKKKTETELKLTEFEKKFEIMDSRIREALSEKILDEIKANKRDLILTNVRIDSLERVERELVNSVQNVEKSLKKFESLERVQLLSKEIEDKIERFKFIEDELRRLSSKMEMMYTDIDKRLGETKRLEDEISRSRDVVAKLRKEVDKNRVQILSKTDKTGLEKLVKAMTNLSKRMAGLENQIKVMRFDIRKKVPELEESHKRLDQLVRGMKPEEFKKMVEDLNARMMEIRKDVEGLEGRYKKELEKAVVKIKAPPVFETQINELIERTIFLESRLAALESTFKKTAIAQPIILE